MYFNLLYQDLGFVAISTAFLGITGWAWRALKPYRLPQPLPSGFKIWFLTVQIGGGLVPLIVLILSLWQGQYQIAAVFISYFVLLGLQVLSESISLRWFQSTAFVMVPYLYIPYRVWQLYQGRNILASAGDAAWVKNLLLAEIGLWVLNYGLDLAQLPRLFHWADPPERGLEL